MKNYDKNIEWSSIRYLDANNLYGRAMSQKLPANDFKWVKQEELSKFNEDFIKDYDENSNKGYFLEVDIDYPKELFNLHKDLPWLKGWKSRKTYLWHRRQEKICFHIRALKQALNHGLILKKYIE